MRRLVNAIEESKDPEAEIVLDIDKKDEIGAVALAFIEMVKHARSQQMEQHQALLWLLMKL